MRVRLVCPDLFQRARLEPPWRAAGAEFRWQPETAPPDLWVVDLTANGAEQAIGRARRDAPDSRVVAFGPHADAAAFARARQAGAHEVVPRSRILARVLDLLGTSPGGSA